MSETNDSHCIFMTMTSNTRCSKNSTRQHPAFDILGLREDNVFCTIHHNYLVKHNHINLANYLFDCPKRKKLIDRLEETSKEVKIQKILHEVFLDACKTIELFVKEEEMIYESMMKKFMTGIERIKCDFTKKITNVDLKFMVDRMKNSGQTNTYIPTIRSNNLGLISIFGTSYKLVEKVSHIPGQYVIKSNSYVIINEEMEKEFFYYKKIREQLMRDYQMKMERLRIKADENKEKIIRKFGIKPKKKCVFEFLKRKEGSRIHYFNHDTYHNTILMTATPKGCVIYNKTVVKCDDAKAEATQITVDDQIVDLSDVTDFDEYFGYRKEVLSKALSYKNIAKHVMDFLDVQSILDLHEKIRNYRIIASIHNYLRLEPTRIFPSYEDYNICDVFLSPIKNEDNRGGFVFQITCKNKKNKTYIPVSSEKPYYKRAGRDQNGNIYFNFLSLCNEIIYNIPEYEKIIDQLISLNGMDNIMLFPNGYDSFFKRTSEGRQPVTKFLDRKELSREDVDSLYEIGKKVTYPGGINSPFSVWNGKWALRLNPYIINYVENVLNINF